MGIPKIRLFLWEKVLIKAVSLISVGIVQDANHNIAFNRLKLLMDYTKAPAKSRTLRRHQKSGFYHHGQIYSIHTQYQYMYIASDVSDWFYTVWFSLSFTQMKQLVISSEHKAILECRRLEVEAYKMERHISLHVSKIPLQLSKSWPTYHTMISSLHFNNRDLKWPISGRHFAHNCSQASFSYTQKKTLEKWN